MFRINLLKWLFLILLSVGLSACMVMTEGPTKNVKASKINVQLGIGYYQQGKYDIANEKLIKALDQDPKSSQAHYAYAVLQNHFKKKEKTEFHFRKAIELNPENSEALSNFGAYLCNDGRMAESEEMFLRAVEDPLFKTPELAYTNAAVCLLKADSSQTQQAKEYYEKALAARSNFLPALINLAELVFDENNFEFSKLYLDRYHRLTRPTARSLWLLIRNELELENKSQAFELAKKLGNDFPGSAEYKSWIALEK